jgi:ribosomal protein S18 acetylase RimI-like enzyme
MSFFHRTLNLAGAVPRPLAPADHSAVSRLLAVARRRFLGVSAEDLAAILAAGPGALLAAGGDVWAAAVCERTAPETAWLRALALADGLPQGPGLDALLAAYHLSLRDTGVTRSFYVGVQAGDVWLRAGLSDRGYTRHTEVVGYEKLRMDAPAAVNRSAVIRRARPADLSDVLALDHACFAAQWHKDQHAIAPALVGSPCFLVAERHGLPATDGAGAGALVGYAFVTHYRGRLIHLVRIAVLPAAQGQGIGAHLLAEVIGYARGAGADILTLNTQIDNAPARRLYERFGFRLTGERQTVLELTL